MTKVEQLGRLLLEHGDSLHADHVKMKIAKIFNFDYGSTEEEEPEETEEEEEEEV